MKKLSLYIFLLLMWCNVGFADFKLFFDFWKSGSGINELSSDEENCILELYENSNKNFQSDLNNIGIIFYIMRETKLNEDGAAELLSKKLKVKKEDLDEYIQKNIFDPFYLYRFG